MRQVLLSIAAQDFSWDGVQLGKQEIWNRSSLASFCFAAYIRFPSSEQLLLCPDNGTWVEASSVLSRYCKERSSYHPSLSRPSRVTAVSCILHLQRRSSNPQVLIDPVVRAAAHKYPCAVLESCNYLSCKYLLAASCSHAPGRLRYFWRVVCEMSNVNTLFESFDRRCAIVQVMSFYVPGPNVEE